MGQALLIPNRIDIKDIPQQFTEQLTNLHHHKAAGILLFFSFLTDGRGTRERSPPLPKIAHPSLPRLGRSQASTQRSAMHEPPPGGTACLITVSPVPGKLTLHDRRG